MSFLLLFVNLLELPTFRNGASFLIRQFELVNYDNYINYFYKPSYDVDNSSDVKTTLHYPYPSQETYHLDNDRNDHLSYIVLHFLKLGYIRGHSQVFLLNQRYIVR